MTVLKVPPKAVTPAPWVPLSKAGAVVQRVAVVRHLEGPVAARDSAEQRAAGRPDAVGAVWVRTGGQAWAHIPVQWLWVGVSALNAYRVAITPLTAPASARMLVGLGKWIGSADAGR